MTEAFPSSPPPIETEIVSPQKILILDADQTQNGLFTMALRYGREFGFTGPNCTEPWLAAAFGKSAMTFGKQEIYEDPNRLPRIFKKVSDTEGHKWIDLLGDNRFRIPDGTFREILSHEPPSDNLAAKCAYVQIKRIYDAEMLLPEEERRFKNTDNAFNAVRNIIRQDPRLHENLTLIPAAKRGKKTLLARGYVDGGTLTARIKTEEMSEATQRWFKAKNMIPKGAPDDYVEIVKDPKDKILRMIEKFLLTREGNQLKLIDNPNVLVLIDDSYPELVKAIVEIYESDADQTIKDAFQYIIIGGYGGSREKAVKQQQIIDDAYGITEDTHETKRPHILPLPNWNEESINQFTEAVSLIS